MKEIFLNKKTCLLIVAAIGAFLCLWKLGAHPLNQWDESWYGMNALEMLNHHDYINYYFEGRPDTWIAKPPLSIWLISFSYKLFGFNEFALRLPSAIAGILFFIVLFEFICLFRSPLQSMFSCLILMACKGIIGNHVARTGDMDALLVLFLMLYMYFFMKAFISGKGKYYCLAGIGLGLAFYTKGSACFLYLPGTFAFVIMTGTFLKTIRNGLFWAGIGIFICIAASWYMLTAKYGNTFQFSYYTGHNSWETMWIYDTWMRFTDPAATKNPTFLLTTMDAKFNIWNYVFYFSILASAVIFILTLKKAKQLAKIKYDKLVILSYCIIGTMAITLGIASNKLPWYIAPALPFAAIVTADFIFNIRTRYPSLIYPFALLLVFTLSRNFMELNNVSRTYASQIQEKEKLFKNAHSVYVYRNLAPDIKLYAYWNVPQSIPFLECDSVFNRFGKEDLCLVSNDYPVKDSTGQKTCTPDYCLIHKKE